MNAEAAIKYRNNILMAEAQAQQRRNAAAIRPQPVASMNNEVRLPQEWTYWPINEEDDDDPLGLVVCLFVLIKVLQGSEGKEVWFGRVCDSVDVRTSIIGFSKSSPKSKKKQKKKIIMMKKN